MFSYSAYSYGGHTCHYDIVYTEKKVWTDRRNSRGMSSTLRPYFLSYLRFRYSSNQSLYIISIKTIETYVIFSKMHSVTSKNLEIRLQKHDRITYEERRPTRCNN